MNDRTVLNNTLDAAAGITILGAWLSWLPEVAAGLAAIWTLIRIYEWMRVRIFKKEGDFK